MNHPNPPSVPAGLLLADTSPNATTCILIGPLGAARGIEFGQYRAVLWFVDRAGQTAPPDNLPLSQLEVIPIETASLADYNGALERFLRLNPRHLPALYITADVLARHVAAYQPIIDEVHAQMEDVHRIRLTRQQDGFTWQKHLLCNAPAYARRRLPAAWAGLLRDLPAFVCGAGPSLDVSIEALVTAAARGVIFSVDSALRALARHGVQADFAVSIDAAKEPAKCLSADTRPGHVVLSSVSPPAWQEALPPAQLSFVSSRQLTDDWLATVGVPRTAITASESCGSTAIDLALHLGCNPVYLFGIDLAVDPVNQAQRHQQEADPALYRASNYDPTAQLPRVPGNYVEKVPCFALGDWRALNDRLSTQSPAQVYNVTDRGARLNGTTVVHPRDLVLRPGGDAKTPRLAQLAGAADAPDATVDTALSNLRAVGDRCHHALPALRRAFKQGGPAALAEAFRAVVLDPACGRVLGAFALKLMPHLVPPVEGDATFWQTLLDEYVELADLARTAGHRR